MSELRLVVDSRDRLGEGPCWSAAEGRLYWFDIKGKRLNWFEPSSDARGSFELPLRASAAVVRAGGGLLVACEKGLAAVDTKAEAMGVTHPFDLGPGFRSNDGKIDPEGRFWWSIMDDDGGKRAGAVFRTGPDGKTERMLNGIHIPNTISFSPDGRLLYMADSLRQALFVHETADLSKAREFAHTRGQAATPDGSAVDAEGYLWNAQWGGWRVVRYAPDGSVDRIVRVPVEQPTSCAFGGPDLSTLYITSAWDGLSPQARAGQPYAGSLFALEPGVKGLPLPVFQA